MLWTRPVEATAEGADRFAASLRPYVDLGFTEVHVMPFTSEPVGYINALGEHVVPRLLELD